MPPQLRAIRIRRRTVLKLIALIAVIVVANLAAGWIADSLRFELRPSNEELVHKVILMSAAAYALLIAIPFVPGVEIGLTLIGMLGPAIVFLVYVSTIAGLVGSFAVGRLVSLNTLAKQLEEFNLRKASQLLSTIQPMSRNDQLNFLVSEAPNRLIPFLLRHRYLALAILINLPGNIVIGGGGGISLMAGASRLYSVPGFVTTVSLAVSPVPIAILILGKEFVSG